MTPPVRERTTTFLPHDVRKQQSDILHWMLVVLLVLTPLTIVLSGVLLGTRVFDLQTNLPVTLVLIAIGVALVLLRRGYFTAAVGLAGASLLIRLAELFVSTGLEGAEAYLLALFIPITLVGLLAGRAALVVTSAVTALLVGGVAYFEAQGVPWIGYAPRETSVAGTVVLYGFLLVLFAFFLDRFGLSFRSALQRAAERERALTEVNERLEREIAERRRAENEIARLLAEAEEANRLLENRVEQRTVQLSEANRELEAFSYSVSHDLRAPLRGIAGFSQALQDDYRDRLDGTGVMYLERIRAGASRMGGLIDALLNLSRISRSRIEPRPVDLAALARDIAEDLASSEPERDTSFVIPASLPVVGDEPLLRIVLDNLMGNAWKFTRGLEAASIEVGVLEREGGTREFFVRDTGVGFDMSYSDKLFTAFQRLHTQEYEGTGIGLATVARIVHRHGGVVRAHGEPGRGATFSFTLPPDAGAAVAGVDEAA